MLFLLLLLLLASSAAHVAAARPHILLMVLDDIGRTDTGIYGKSNIPMPHLVQLASRGAVLENFYTQPVCSPTRSSLMAGRYPFRMGMQHLTTQLPGMAAGIPLDTPILPELLKKAGYSTHAIGKWHCGYATWQHTPYFRGFSSYLGYLQAQGDYRTHLTLISPDPKFDGYDMWDNDKPLWSAVGKYSLDLYDERITQVIQDYTATHASEEDQALHPLFVYLAHQTVHIPLQPKKDEVERCGHLEHKVRRVYCSMLVELDDSIGSMVQQLKQHQLWDNTLVLVLTDNGGMVNFSPTEKDGFPALGASQGSNYPLRGSKATLFDGGVRSLGFVSGGYYPQELAGQRFTGLAHVVDLTATVLAAAKLYPLNRGALKLDGIDLWPQLLLNQKDDAGVQRRTEVPINIINAGKSYSAVRFGKYKLVVRDLMIIPAEDMPDNIPYDDSTSDVMRGWFDANGDLMKEDKPADAGDALLLFDLEKDVEERHDLASDHPDLVQHGLDLIQSYVSGGDYLEPQPTSKAAAALGARPVLGVFRPFLDAETWTRDFKRQQREQRLGGKEDKMVVVA